MPQWPQSWSRWEKKPERVTKSSSENPWAKKLCRSNWNGRVDAGMLIPASRSWETVPSLRPVGTCHEGPPTCIAHQPSNKLFPQWPQSWSNLRWSSDPEDKKVDPFQNECRLPHDNGRWSTFSDRDLRQLWRRDLQGLWCQHRIPLSDRLLPRLFWQHRRPRSPSGTGSAVRPSQLGRTARSNPVVLRRHSPAHSLSRSLNQRQNKQDSVSLRGFFYGNFRFIEVRKLAQIWTLGKLPGSSLGQNWLSHSENPRELQWNLTTWHKQKIVSGCGKCRIRYWTWTKQSWNTMRRIEAARVTSFLIAAFTVLLIIVSAWGQVRA